MSVFQFQDYKEFLKAWISDHQENWGLITRLATAAGCQRSFFSRVLNGPIHLTPDHAYGLCHYWKFSPDETEYYITLLEQARAASKSYREHLVSKLNQLRRMNERLSNRVQRASAGHGEKELLYYSAWHWSAIHILVSIPEFQTVSAISKKLQLPAEIVQSTLEKLEEFNFVKKENSRWVYSSSELHVANDSPLVNLHHNNWRQRALIDAQNAQSAGLHFTVVQSMSRKTYDQIKLGMLDFIELVSREAGPSKEEELVAITCDIFRV